MDNWRNTLWRAVFGDAALPDLTQEQSDRLDNLIALLDEQSRMILVAAFRDLIRVKDICVQLNLTEGKVRYSLLKSLRSFRIPWKREYVIKNAEPRDRRLIPKHKECRIIENEEDYWLIEEEESS